MLKDLFNIKYFIIFYANLLLLLILPYGQVIDLSQEQTTYFDTYIFQNKFLIVPLTIILLIVTMGQLVKVEKLKKSLIISTTILSLLFSLGTLLFISLPIIGFNPKYGVYLSLILGPISYLMAKSHFASK